MRYVTRRLLLAAFAVLIAAPASAQDTPPRKLAVASTSIIADLVRNVGGDKVAVKALVGANGDAHVYSPTPGDAREVAAAAIVFVNGLGLEGWLPRLVSASGSKAPVIVVSKGVAPRRDGGAEGELHPVQHPRLCACLPVHVPLRFNRSPQRNPGFGIPLILQL